MKIHIKTFHPRKRSLITEEVPIHNDLRAHKKKCLREETKQEHKSLSISEIQESFRASKESSLDSLSLRQKSEENVAAKIRRFAATILRAKQKKMDCVKWEEKMRYEREKLKKEEEEACQTEPEAAKEEKEDKVLPVYFLVNNKCLL